MNRANATDAAPQQKTPTAPTKEDRKRSAKIAVLEGIVQGGPDAAQKKGIDYPKAQKMLADLRAEEVVAKPTPKKPAAKKPAAKKPAAKKTGNPMEYKFTGKNADLDDDNWSLLSLRHERQMTLDGDPEAQGFDIDAIDAKMAQIRIMYDDPTRPMPESMADRAARGGPSVGSQMASAPIDSSPRMSNDLPKKSPGVNKAVASANARLKAKGIRHRITRNDIDRVARDSVYDDGTTQAELDEMGMTRDIVQRDVDEARKNIIRHLTSGRTGPFKDFMDELVDSDDLLSAMAILTAEGRGRTYSIA